MKNFSYFLEIRAKSGQICRYKIRYKTTDKSVENVDTTIYIIKRYTPTLASDQTAYLPSSRGKGVPERATGRISCPSKIEKFKRDNAIKMKIGKKNKQTVQKLTQKSSNFPHL